jgi:hypothetical protein
VKDEVKSEFLLANCDLEEVANELGMKPTKVRRKGEVRRASPTGDHPPILEKENVWIFRSDTPLSASVDEHIDRMLSLLMKNKEPIAKLSGKYYGELSVYGFAHDADRIAFHLEKDVISRLAELGIELDVDVYPLDDDE